MRNGMIHIGTATTVKYVEKPGGAVSGSSANMKKTCARPNGRARSRGPTFLCHAVPPIVRADLKKTKTYI